MSKFVHRSGVELSWQKFEDAQRGWYALCPSVDGWFPGEANVDGRWAGYATDGKCFGKGKASDLVSAKAAVEKCLLDNGIVTLAPEAVPVPEKLYYKGAVVEWCAAQNGWEELRADGMERLVYCASAHKEGNWMAYIVAERIDLAGCGVANDIESAKKQAEESLLGAGVITTKPRVLPTTGAYTFHFRADRGGATVVATVVRGPDTTVLYGVSFCSPRDSFDKNLGRRMAAFRLIDKPSTLVLPGLAGPREIKAAILAALVIPPGNRLVK